jgi:hypothetical protein
LIKPFELTEVTKVFPIIKDRINTGEMMAGTLSMICNPEIKTTAVEKSY